MKDEAMLTRELLALVERAVSVLQRHAPPDGLSDHDALTEFYGIFDGPEYRIAIAHAEQQKQPDGDSAGGSDPKS